MKIIIIGLLNTFLIKSFYLSTCWAKNSRYQDFKQIIFEKLKFALIHSSIFQLPNFKVYFILEIDSNEFIIGTSLI